MTRRGLLCRSAALLLFALLGAGGSAAPAQEAASSSTLTVRVTGLRSSRGAVLVALHDSAKGFPGGDQALRRETVAPARDKTASVVFKGLKPGVYAVAILHDENQNGKLDTGLFGIPREGYGASNNPRPRFKAPSFDAAKFDLTGPEKAVEIKTRY